MAFQSKVGARGVQRFVRGTRAARAFAPLLLLGAFVRCSGDGEEPDAFASGPEQPSLGVESADTEQGLELAGEAELDFGKLTQAQVQGTVCVPGAVLGCSTTRVVQCNSTGTNTNLLRCAPGFSCFGGQCLTQALGTVCLPNVVVGCSGPSLLVCNSTSTNTIRLACPSGTTCSVDQCI